MPLWKEWTRVALIGVCVCLFQWDGEVGEWPTPLWKEWTRVALIDVCVGLFQWDGEVGEWPTPLWTRVDASGREWR